VKIVSISTNYPNPYEPGLGLFVRSRLQHMAGLAEMVVIAPLPLIDYSNPRRRWFRNWRGPRRRRDAAVEALHPRWLYPPGGTSLNALCMFLRLACTLARLRVRFRFDWIDAHFGYPEGVSAALLAWLFRCPFSITMRGNEPMFAATILRGRVIRWAVRRASAVLAVSNELREFAIACGADPARAFTVPNGVDREVFRPRNREQCRAEFGMAPDRLVIACAGELIEAKGHHLVLEAVRELVAENAPVEVYLAGGVARGGAPFAHIFRKLEAMGCLVVTHAINMGKGRALKTGINDLLARAHAIYAASLRRTRTGSILSMISVACPRRCWHPRIPSCSASACSRARCRCEAVSATPSRAMFSIL
jgi:glycosyltransferase involved in cell wall biosynthesis